MQIGPYHLREELGRGGNAVVFRARGARGEDCAVKLLHRQDHTARQRFLREAQVLAELSHPAIVPLRSVGEHDGRLYLAMPFYAGKSLADRITEEGPLQPEQAVELAQSLADGLAYAHGHGVLHRDLKPDNVLLDDAGVARLTDFGLARRTDLQETRLSKSGALMGTPGFWAPEQAGGGGKIGPWTDIYGLGATLYCMLTGMPPLLGENLVEVMRAVNEDPVTPASSHVPEVDPVLDGICLRCLAKQPDDRFDSAQELHDALAAYLRGELHLRRPRWPVALFGATALAVGAAVAVWATRPSAPPEPAPTSDSTGQTDPAAEPLAPVHELLAAGEHTEVLRALDALPGVETTERLYLRAEALLQLGDFDAAHAVTGALLERDPDYSPARVQRSRIALERGETADAIEELNAAVDLGAGTQAVFLRAQIRMLQGNRAAAERDLERLLADEPSYRPAWDLWLELLRDHHEQRLPVVNRALRVFPDDVQLLRDRGRISGFLGRTKEALRSLERVIELETHWAPDFVARSMAHHQLGDYHAALADAQRAVGLSPGLAEAWRELGLTLIRMQRVVEARHALTQAFAFGPRDLRTAVGLAETCDSMGAYQWSVPLLDYALGRSDPRSPRLYFLLGRGLLSFRRHADAERLFTRALNSGAKNGDEIRGLRGVARLAQGQDALARDDLLAGVRGRPRDSLLWYNLGATHLNLRENERAVQALGRAYALQEDPEQDPELLVTYANALARTGKLERARELRDKHCELAPNDPEGWAVLAQLCLKLGDLDAALEAATRARALRPTDLDLGVLLADVHAKRDELTQCTDILSELIRAHPKQFKLYMVLAEHFNRAKLYDLAATLMDTYVKLAPNDPEGWGRRASYRAQAEDFAGALEDLEVALRLDPDDGVARYNRGILRVRAGKLVEGLGDLAQVAGRVPDDADVQRNYANALHFLGRDEEARAVLTVFLQRNPGSPQAAELREQLASYRRPR